ncbi:hypothetical protein [Candidatus Ichthyocystis sparus]|nr:hypothetical protein [Candidatus Ichthyocystis sparus]
MMKITDYSENNIFYSQDENAIIENRECTTVMITEHKKIQKK